MDKSIETEAEFRLLAERLLEPRQSDAILAKLWRLDDLDDIGKVLELFAVKSKGDHHVDR